MRLPLCPKQMAEEASRPATANGEEKVKDKEKCSGKSRKVVRDERERRDKMTDLYFKLQMMVPNVLPKEPRERIISGTISYIKDLEQCIKDLEAQKEKKRKAPAATSRTTLSLQTPRSSVNATLTGNTVFFGIQSAAIPGLASRIVQVFETPNTNAQVLAASTSRMEHTMTVTITAVIGDGGDAERTIEQLKADLRKCLP